MKIDISFKVKNKSDENYEKLFYLVYISVCNLSMRNNFIYTQRREKETENLFIILTGTATVKGLPKTSL